MKMTHHAVAQWFGLIAFVAFSLPALSQPIILTQPQGETVIIGGNASFSVTVAGSASSATLPTVTSGTLQLWLKADEGVITNAAGQVSQWQDQSGNKRTSYEIIANQMTMLGSKGDSERMPSGGMDRAAPERPAQDRPAAAAPPPPSAEQALPPEPEISDEDIPF